MENYKADCHYSNGSNRDCKNSNRHREDRNEDHGSSCADNDRRDMLLHRNDTSGRYFSPDRHTRLPDVQVNNKHRPEFVLIYMRSYNLQTIQQAR